MQSSKYLFPGTNLRYYLRKLQGIMCHLALPVTASVILAGFVSAQTCTNGYRITRLSPNDSGDVVYGPVCVEVPINGIRYSAVLKLQTTVSMVDLTGVFKAPGGVGSLKSLDDIGHAIIVLKTQLDDLQTKNQNAIFTVNQAISSITAIVTMSDMVFQQPDGAQKILTQLQSADFQTILTKARSATFQPTDEFYNQAIAIQEAAVDLQLNRTPATDPDKARLAAELAAIKDIADALSAYLRNADKTTAYIKQSQIFQLWDNRARNLTADDFVVRRNVGCHTFGNQTRTINVVLNRTDMLPTLTGAAPTSADYSSTLVTVNCPSPFSISAGLEMSFLKTYSYGLLPATTPGSYTYGIIKTTSFSPMPVAMLHERLFESRDRKFAVQMGFGVAAHAQDNSAGGTGAEYLLGLGVSIYHTIYLTPGWHAGRAATLSPGYKIGDPAASGATAAPLVNGYISGFGLAITFTKP